jgi:hypothetical protein
MVLREAVDARRAIVTIGAVPPSARLHVRAPLDESTRASRARATPVT